MTGYLENGRVVAGTDGGWFRTGDVATLDVDGNVSICGRADGLILRGGMKIDPAEIEQVIEMHPAIRKAAVVGVPSRVAGEQDIHAYFEGPAFDADRAGPDSPELREWCRRRLQPNQIPRSFHLLEEIPTKEDGSIRRGFLPWITKWNNS
jgi:long-chain acyl-CoA synthetase